MGLIGWTGERRELMQKSVARGQVVKLHEEERIGRRKAGEVRTMRGQVRGEGQRKGEEDDGGEAAKRRAEVKDNIKEEVKREDRKGRAGLDMQGEEDQVKAGRNSKKGGKGKRKQDMDEGR
ncbi:hypothetical protein KM043_018224 [Ampulex compressa]|nr:hypothetical protein KM043_018224 [Ampulex compressa]